MGETLQKNQTKEMTDKKLKIKNQNILSKINGLQLNKKNQIIFVLLFFILVLGGFLRLYKIRDYMTFLGDEGRDVLVVRHFITNFDVPFIGPTASVGGFFLGPIYYYFMTPALLLSRMDPVGPSIMVALFGIATILLIFLFGKELFTIRVGMVASLFYAISPLVIAQSRSSWNPNIVPFFSLLMMYALWKSVQTKKSLWFLVVGVCFGIGVQLHYLYFFLSPVILTYLLFYYRSKKYLKNYLLIGLGIVLPLLPFIGFEIKNNFPNLRSLLNFLTAGKEVAVKIGVVDKLSNLIFRLFGRLVFFYPPPEQVGTNPENKWFVVWALIVVSSIFFSLAVLFYMLYLKRRKQEMLMVLWLIFGIGLFSFYTRGIYDYYFVILFPWPFILVAYSLDIFWKNKFTIPIFFIITISLVMLNIKGQPFQYPPNRQLAQVKKAAETVVSMTDKRPYNFALVTGQNSDHAYRYFLELWGRAPITIENFENDPDRKTVTEQLIVVCEVSNCQPLGNPLWEIAGFGQADIENQTETGPLTIYKLIPYKQDINKNK